MPDRFSITNIGTWARTNDGELETFEKLISVIKEFTPPDELDNQIINVNDEDEDDELEGSAILYADRLPSTSQPTHVEFGEINMIAATISGGEFRFSADLEPDLIDVLTEIYDQFLEVTDLHVVDFDARFESKTEFSDLDILIEGPENCEFQGVNFLNDGFNYRIESGWSKAFTEMGLEEEGSEVEGRETSVARVESIDHFEVDKSGEFITENLESIEAVLERYEP